MMFQTIVSEAIMKLVSRSIRLGIIGSRETEVYTCRRRGKGGECSSSEYERESATANIFPTPTIYQPTTCAVVVARFIWLQADSKMVYGCVWAIWRR